MSKNSGSLDTPVERSSLLKCPDPARYDPKPAQGVLGSSTMQMQRRSFALVLALGLMLAGCGGQTSRLITVHTGGSGGPIKLEVANSTGAPINSVFMAKHDKVKAALRHDSSGQETEGEHVWGGDLL